MPRPHRLSPPFRLVLHVLRSAAILAILSTLAAPAAADWPQFRGPEGLGVAPEAGPLPTTWAADSANVRWRAPIPGAGTSSPIATGGRVFLTTAYEGSLGVRGLVLLALAAALALIFFVLLFRRLRRRAPAGGSGATVGVWAPRVLVGGSLLFVLLALAMIAVPEAFFPLGNPGRAWRAGGGIGLLGLTAAIGWFRPASRWRFLGAALVVACAGMLYAGTPSTPLGPAPFERRAALLVPSLGLACWYVVAWLRARGGSPDPHRVHAPSLAAPMALLAALVFLAPNFLNALLRVVVCVDLASGEVLWETPAFAAPPEQKWRQGTFAMPTPATDGETVFAYFGSGLAGADLDGKLLWSRRFPGYARATRYGAASSPVVADDAVLLVQEREHGQSGPPSWIAAFDKRSGRELWKVTPPDAHDSYTTPLLVATSDGDELVTSSWNEMVAYDAGSGERRWSFAHASEQMVASMARAGDLVAITGGVYGDKALMVVRIGGADGPELLWKTNKRVAGISSPVFYGGLLFTVTDAGIMSCYDAESGEELWKARLEGAHYASLVAGDGKVYAVSTDGATSVIAAAPEYRRLAVNELGESVYASPAIAGGCLLIRSASGLYCIEADDRQS